MSSQHDADPARPAPERHSVFGRVTDPGERVVPAEVFWIDASHADEETVELFNAHRVATADNDGCFWAADLPPGPCLLVPDYRHLHVEDDRVRIAHGTRVTLPTDEQVALRFPRERREYGAIHGVVRDAIDQRPGSRVHVKLLDVAGNVVREGATHTDGTFHFEMLLTPAKYKLVVAGTRRHVGSEAVLDLALNKRFDLKIPQLRQPPVPRHRVRVHVENWLGLPVAGARVEVDVPGFTIAPAKTDGLGVADVQDLPARPTLVKAMAPDHWPGGAQLPAATPDGGDEVTIALERAVRLRVRILDAATGRPVRHANLSVKGAGVDAVALGGLLSPPGQPPLDHYDLPVRTGCVTVRAESPGYARAEEAVEVSDRADEALEVALRLGPRQ
jgi:hypothetical protein